MNQQIYCNLLQTTRILSMISQPYRKGLSITSLIFILSLIFISCHCDCPIARYRSEFKLGQAKVVQTQSVANQLTAQNFSFILDAPLLKSNPLIFIGLTGFSYTLANNSVNFQIVDAKDPSLVSLSFTLSSKGSVESNRIWSFRFLAIQKKYSIIDGGTFRSLGDTSIVSRKVGVNDLSSDNYDVAVFINGIVASSQSPLSSLSIQLTNCKIDKGILSFEMKKSSDTIKIQSISYSLLSYNKAQFQGQNQALLKPIQFNSLSPALNLPLQQSLLHSDLTFFGLSMITFDSSTTSILDISMDNKLDTDGVKFTVSATYSRPFEMLVWQTHVKDPYLCSFCKNSPIMFENRYCVGTCPKDYIAQAGQYMLECKKCPIEQFRVPDYKTNKCVCSLQYFENLQTNLCAPCHYTCITCMGEGSNQCLTCQVNPKVKNTFRQFVKDSSNSLTGKCICPAGYLEIDQVITCEACHPDCRTCSGPAQTDCIECNKQRQMNQFGVCQCKAGYTSQSDGSCVCFNPRFQSNGACVDPLNACGPNQVLVTQNLKNNNKNKAITSSCECKTGLYRIKGQCSTCGPNQEYNARKGLCSCTKQSNQLKNGTCLLCPVGKKFNKETESCICKNKNQLENSKGECVSCPTKSIFYNDECVCIFNYFMNEKGKCQKCKKSTDNPQCRKQTGNQL